MEQLKSFAQALILPVLLVVVFGSISLVQFLFLSNVEATAWLESDGSRIALIEKRLGDLKASTTFATASAVDEGAPAACSPRSVRVQAKGDRSLNNETFMDALRGGSGTLPIICSGPVFESVLPKTTVATDWKTLSLFVIASIVVLLVYMAGKPWLPQGSSEQSILRKTYWGLAAVIVVAGANFLFFASGLSSPAESSVADEILPGQLLFFFLLAVLVSPFVEELAFRAWMIPLAAKAARPESAALLSTLIFAAYHWPNGIVEWMFYVVAGATFSALWLRTRSLATCVLAHSAANALTFVPSN